MGWEKAQWLYIIYVRVDSYIKWGEKNSIAVRVDHSNDADSRWYTGSGIYRDVYLVYANPIHINLWGVAYQAEIENNVAEITITTTIKNSIESSSVKVVHELFDTEGHKVASTSKSGTADSKKLTEFSQIMKLKSPACGASIHHICIRSKLLYIMGPGLLTKAVAKPASGKLSSIRIKAFISMG